MAWRKTFPSPLLLLAVLLLAVNALNTPSHALHPTDLTLSTHMREFAVYANEDGVPKLERGDSPAKDPQIIQDSPIPTVTPKVFQASPTPASDAESSDAQPSSTPLPSTPAAAVDVSDDGTDTSANDAKPTVSDVGSASPSFEPSASASPPMPSSSPAPVSQSSPPNGGEPVSVAEHIPSDDDLPTDDLGLSATADEPDDESEPAADPMPTPLKTAVPPGMKKDSVAPPALINSKAPVQLHLEDELPAPKPQPSQSVSPVPTPSQSPTKEESTPSADHSSLDTSMVEEDDQSLQSSFEDEVMISDEEAVPVAVETEGSDDPVSAESAAPVATAIAPLTSSESSASATTVVDDSVSTPVEETSDEAQDPDVVGNVEVDESFTCTYFGKGSVPNFENPDENSFTGSVATFAGNANAFPELAPQYLSHVHGASWSYSFSVDESFAYDVVLGFAEVYDIACKAGEGSGYRIFDTWVGDQTTRIDVMGIVGCGKPLQKVYPKITPSGNTITVAFKQVSQHAMLSTMCYRKAGAVSSKSPVTDPKPSPVQEPKFIATAIPPTSSLAAETLTEGEQPESIPKEETKQPGLDSQPGSMYKCVSFGLEGISGYDIYKRNAVSGDAHVFAGSGKYKNALPEPYWYYMHGQDWSYSLEVSSSSPQNLVIGYAETSPDACDMDREFTVSANGGVKTATVSESVGCGVIYQTELEGIAPVNEVIDLSFTSISGDALVSVLCYADASGAKTTTVVAIEPNPQASIDEVEEETPAPPEEADTEPVSTVAQSDSTNEAGNDGSCFSFGQNTVPGFLSAASIPQGVSYYSDMKASVSGAPQEDSVFSSHIYGSHFSLTISNKDQAPKSVFIGFAEIYKPACVEDQRLFSVTVGSLTKTIDVFEEAGCSAALVLKIGEVTPDDGNNIEVVFNAVKDNAMISAVCVTESDGNSLGKPSASFVPKLPPLSSLSNSATVTIASESENKLVETPVPSPTVVTVSIPNDNGVDVSEEEEESQSDGIVASDEKLGGNPKGSPYPEFNGLIDATITEAPVTAVSNVGTNPLSAPEEDVGSGDPAHVDITTDDSQEDEAQIDDILLPSDFSQTTFGEAPGVESSSPMGLSSNEGGSDAPMHPTSLGSGGFPQSAAMEDVDSKQGNDAISNESSEVIVVLEEKGVPSLSPSATPSPAQNLESEIEDNDGTQAIQPSSSPSPIPTSGVIIADQEGNPLEPSPSPSETLTASANPDSSVIISIESGGGEEQESSTPSPATEVTLAVEEEGSSQDSQPSSTPSAAQSSTSGSTVIPVSETDDPEIPPTPEESTVTIIDVESDAEDELIPSLTPMEEGLEDAPTAIPPGGVSKGLENNDQVSSNDSDDSVVLALDSDPVEVSIDSDQNPSVSPTPVSVAIPPNPATAGTEGDEEGEVEVLVPEAQEALSASSSSEDDAKAVVIAVDGTDISSLQPSPSVATPEEPVGTVTDNQIEIEVLDTPTPTPSPSTASASSGNDDPDVVIIDGETSDTSTVEAPDGVSLGGVSSDGASPNLGGTPSVSPSPTPSLIVSVTGSDTVIIGTSGAGAEASPIPASSVVPVAAPEAVAEVPDVDADVIQVSETENTEPVGSTLTGDDNVPSIIEGDYKELIGTVPAGNGFSIGMGILGALLVLLLLVLLFFAIRSDGVAYSYSSQYSSRKPSDYGDGSQGGYTEGLNQGAGVYQNESYAGDGASGYASGQPPMESQPIDGSENFLYERPEQGLGGVSGSYGNVGPDTYAAYSSLNLQDGPTTLGDETNMYTQSGTMTMEGQMFRNGSGTRGTTFSGTDPRRSEQPTEYGEATTFDHTEYGEATTFDHTEYGEATTFDHTEVVSHEVPTTMVDETLPGASEFEQRISMFGGRGGSRRTSAAQDTKERNSFHDNRSVARPNLESASSGNQGREYGMVLQGTGYETVTKEERDQYNIMQEAATEQDSPDVTDTRIGSGLEGSERMLSVSSTPTAAPSPYETDMQGQLVTDSDSGNGSYQHSPVLASESASAASADMDRSRTLRRARSSDIYNDSVLDDYRHNESSVRESARHRHGTMELRSDLSNDGPWPWWWSDQKDQKGIFEQSPGPAPEVFDKENSSLPSNNQSPVEQSSSGLSTEDAKAAVAVADTMILKPSEIARLGHLPTSSSKWQRQYSSTSDGTSRERFENNPYFDELRKRREPYVKTVANRLSTGVKVYSTESGESLLEQARKEFEEQHSQHPSQGFNDNDPSSWVTQGVEV